MDTRALLQGLRFIDSFFPSGGYAFSSGLEAAVQDGAVRNATELSRYVEDLLRGGVGTREAVAVKLAHRAATSGRLHIALTADHELDAMKIGRDSRLASRQMGRQIIKIAAEQIEGRKILRDYRAAIETEQTPGHLAVVLGLTLGASGWKREEAVAAFLYHTAVGFVSAALKLLPIGQREGQRLLESWLPLMDRISREAGTTTRMSSWSPIQDIYGMRHGRLEWRLFRS
jgi:urease accessory protein